MLDADERGQAIQVGAILFFAFLVIGFTSYQAVIVPQQNERAEFEHSQAVQEDVTELRSAVLNSAFDGERPSIELRLGTRYPFRLFAINPGPVGGTVQTTDARSVNVSGVSDVCPGPERSRQLTYSADYGYLQNSPGFHVENTVSYRQYDDRAIVSSGQKLVNGNRINLVPIRNEYSENGIAAKSVEFSPGQIRTTSVSNATVKVPTQLSEERWVEVLDGEVNASNIDVLNDEDGDPTNDMLELTPSGDYTVICTPVGVGGDPPGGARASVSDGLGGDDSVNPAGSGSVVLSATEFDDSSDEIELTFKNTGDEDLNFSRARVAFYYEPNRNAEVESLKLKGSPDDDEFFVGDALEPVDQMVEVEAGETESITLSDSEIRKDDLFEFGVEYSDGSSARYFVDVADSIGGATLGPNEVAYDDQNGNGFYDSSETTYKENDFTGLDNGTVNLVIAKDVSRNGGVSAKTSTITVESGVTVNSSNNQVELISYDGDINIQDANIDGDSVTLKAGTNSGTGDIRAEDARLVTVSGSNIQVTPPTGNTFFVNSNGPPESDGGTYIVDRSGAPNNATLNQGSLDGTPERGNVTDNS
ncbi:hypothetical protein BRD04_07795 [Halobacteriales archaeon QS_9_67_17]|nr:MAG: hypothetical protein BRD04_07795 [Halobacteriales archaeon QS_9_67_17]